MFINKHFINLCCSQKVNGFIMQNLLDKEDEDIGISALVFLLGTPPAGYFCRLLSRVNFCFEILTFLPDFFTLSFK